MDVENYVLGTYCLQAMNGQHGSAAKEEMAKILHKVLLEVERYRFVKKHITWEDERDMGPGGAWRFTLWIPRGNDDQNLDDDIDATIAKEAE